MIRTTKQATAELAQRLATERRERLYLRLWDDLTEDIPTREEALAEGAYKPASTNYVRKKDAAIFAKAVTQLQAQGSDFLLVRMRGAAVQIWEPAR